MRSLSPGRATASATVWCALITLIGPAAAWAQPEHLSAWEELRIAPRPEARFQSLQDLHALSSKAYSQDYSFQGLYASERLNAVRTLESEYRLDPLVQENVKLHVSLAVGHLGCSNFPLAVQSLGASLKGGA